MFKYVAILKGRKDIWLMTKVQIIITTFSMIAIIRKHFYIIFIHNERKYYNYLIGMCGVYDTEKFSLLDKLKRTFTIGLIL